MVKVNWNVDYDKTETVTVDGNEISVKKCIPFEQKIEMANIYVAAALDTEENGYAGENPFAESFWWYLVLKYYTDVELHEDDNDGWIYDYCVQSGLKDAISQAVAEDLDVANDLRWGLMRIMEDRWAKSHSLTASLAEMNSEKTMQALAEIRPLNEMLLDLMQAKNKTQKNESNVVFREFAKKSKK